MTFASVVHPVELGDPPDTGSLRGDLTALVRIIEARVTEPSAAAALSGLAAELRDDPVLAASLDQPLFTEERRWIESMLNRALDRGEMQNAAEPELVRRVLVGPIAFGSLYQPGTRAPLRGDRRARRPEVEGMSALGRHLPDPADRETQGRSRSGARRGLGGPARGDDGRAHRNAALDDPAIAARPARQPRRRAG